MHLFCGITTKTYIHVPSMCTLCWLLYIVYACPLFQHAVFYIWYMHVPYSTMRCVISGICMSFIPPCGVLSPLYGPYSNVPSSTIWYVRVPSMGSPCMLSSIIWCISHVGTPWVSFRHERVWLCVRKSIPHIFAGEHVCVHQSCSQTLHTFADDHIARLWIQYAYSTHISRTVDFCKISVPASVYVSIDPHPTCMPKEGYGLACRVWVRD